MPRLDARVAGTQRTPRIFRYVSNNHLSFVYGSNLWQVIIDNMMNLEVLFHSADLTGNNTLRRIAATHADTTMLNHIRPDGTHCHIYVLDDSL